MAAIFVLAFFVFLFGISIINQFYEHLHPGWFTRLKVWDFFSVLPKWTFFAPNPGRYDNRILYRDKLQDGQKSDWMELPLIEKRGWLSAIWNPHKRLTKGVSDAVHEMAVSRQISRDVYQETFPVQVPHLFFLNCVLNADQPTQSKERQYVVVASHGFDENTEILIQARSQFYRLG